MTIITPNSITGVTSITALANDLNFYRSDGTAQPVITANINSTGVSTFSSGIQVGAGKSVRIFGSASGYSDIIASSAAGSGQILLPDTGGTLDRLNRAGNVIQVVNYQTGAVATGTTLIPNDNTIPQNTEGNEYMTLAITPTSASNKLVIQVIAFLSQSAGSNWITGALFQDSTANAIAVSADYAGIYQPCHVNFLHYMTAGTTSSTTFKFRAGCDVAGTTTFNGNVSARLYGGALASSITITEIAA